jgi:hypothetical protein
MNVSRRTLLEVLGGTAIGSVGCTPKQKPAAVPTTPPNNRVNLICHGMMLFIYGNDSKFFNILVPRPPDIPDQPGGTTTHPGHVIKLSEYVGGLQNRLMDPKNAGSYRQGQYELVLEPSPSQFVRGSNSRFCPSGPPDGNNDLVLYDPQNPQQVKMNTDILGLTSAYDPKPTDLVYFLIRVPYPTQVYSLAKMDFSGGSVPYDPTGNTARTFKLQQKPTAMGGTHVFSWEKVTNPVFLNYHLPNSAMVDPQPLGPSTTPLLLNLHLYSQPDNWADDDSSVLGLHLTAFNKMVSYIDNTSTSKGQLDLKVQNSAPTDSSVVNPIDGDLSAEDREDLAMLLHGSMPKLVEPVECLQGYGS